jgi:hypothetical protein
MKRLFILKRFHIISTLLIFVIIFGCDNNDNTLVPYAGSSQMSNISVESNSYNPKITWIGGYVSAFGVNKGNKAALDSTLIWLVHSDGDNIKYPITFNVLPSSAQDLTTQYGGKKVNSLTEDNTYTYWVLKSDVWSQVSGKQNVVLQIDSSVSSSTINLNADTAKISPYSSTLKTQSIDVYINIENVTPFGNLGVVSVTGVLSNSPIISWQINDPNAPDSLLSAIGIVEGSQYQSSNAVWEAYSQRDSAGTTIYGKDDVIKQPVQAGQTLSQTYVFALYPSGGLQRNKTYYVWIANKNWDGVTRLRFATGYAYATFNTR